VRVLQTIQQIISDKRVKEFFTNLNMIGVETLIGKTKLKIMEVVKNDK
jgi:hypothetical protein